MCFTHIVRVRLGTGMRSEAGADTPVTAPPSPEFAAAARTNDSNNENLSVMLVLLCPHGKT